MKFGAVYCLYDDHEYLDISLSPIIDQLDRILFLISDTPWYGEKTDNRETIDKVKEICSLNSNCELLQMPFANERDQRNFGLTSFFEAGIDYTFIVDTDEIYHAHEFAALKSFITANPQAYAFHIEWHTYWKKSYHRIQPREAFRPVICVKTDHFLFVDNRNGTTAIQRTAQGITQTKEVYKGCVVPDTVALCHHLSYARSDEKIYRKITTFSHAPEIAQNWYESTWKGWTENMENLHPIVPAQYKTAVPSDFSSFPASLQHYIKEENGYQRKLLLFFYHSQDLPMDWQERLQEVVASIPHETFEAFLFTDSKIKTEVTTATVVAVESYALLAAEMNQVLIKEHADVCLYNLNVDVTKHWLTDLYLTLCAVPEAGIVEGRTSFNFDYSGEETSELEGFLTLIMADVFQSIGLLDEEYDYFPYALKDLALRALMAGYTISNCPQVRLVAPAIAPSLKSKVLNQSLSRFHQKCLYLAKLVGNRERNVVEPDFKAMKGLHIFP